MTRKEAEREADRYRLRANAGQGTLLPSQVARMTISDLIQHFTEHELNDDSNRSLEYRTSYEIYLRRWIEPRWGSMSLAEVRTMAVEDWLRLLKVQVKRTKDAAPGKPDSSRPRHQSEDQNLMSVLFNHAIRWSSWNPAGTDQAGSPERKRRRTPEVLTVEEIPRCSKDSAALLQDDGVPIAATGLRKSELRGLKWRDVDFANRCVLVAWGMVGKELGTLKTETSRKPIPMSAEL